MYMYIFLIIVTMLCFFFFVFSTRWRRSWHNISNGRFITINFSPFISKSVDADFKNYKKGRFGCCYNLLQLFKPIQTISDMLNKPKEKISEEASKGIIYICQTTRAPKTRVSEHTRAIATLDKNSLLAQHHMIHTNDVIVQYTTWC